MNLLSVALILFLIMDPIGNVAIFHKILEPYTAARRLWILLREMLIALAFIFAFYFFGDWLLAALGISEIAVRISSGIILFLAAIKILFQRLGGDFRASYQQDGEPCIIPLAVPYIAGPALLATVMLFANIDKINTFIFPAILVAWICSLAILSVAPTLHKYLRDSGLTALEKVMGMVLFLLAIQRFLEGVRLFIESYPL